MVTKDQAEKAILILRWIDEEGAVDDTIMDEIEELLREVDE